jgi:hypothetical protein
VQLDALRSGSDVHDLQARYGRLRVIEAERVAPLEILGGDGQDCDRRLRDDGAAAIGCDDTRVAADCFDGQGAVRREGACELP